MGYHFKNCKICSFVGAKPKYKLRKAIVWVCPVCGFHYTDYLDPVQGFDSVIQPDALTPQQESYIENNLQFNSQRFQNHADLVQQYANLEGIRILDVGCGGGLFLFLSKQKGAEVLGLELNDARIKFAQSVYGLSVHKYPVEHDFWQRQFKGAFDVITLWDVIEHVNFPLQSLQAVTNLLRPGGLLFLDTPCRDAFYHRFGSLSYRLTFGRFPTFLNAMYANDLFGHKQIFSTREMKELLERLHFEILQFNKIHELSFPYNFYLKKLLLSDVLTEIVDPFAKVFFKIARIRNKMVVVGRKQMDSAGK